MRTTLVAVLAAVGVVLVSCSNGDAVPAPTPETPGLSARDFARVVIEHGGEWRSSQAELANACADLDSSWCARAYLTLGAKAEILQVALSTLRDFDAAGVPAEIQTLETETERAALEVADGVETMRDALECTSLANVECSSFVGEVQGAVVTLSGKLNAWQSYS